MLKLISKVWRRQRGIGMMMVLAFMALSVPLVTGALSLSTSLSKDSEVKTRILKDQYAANGCTQYAYYKVSNETEFSYDITLGDSVELLFGGCTITITKVSEDEPMIVSLGDVVLALDVSGSVNDDELVLLKDASHIIVDHFDLEGVL